MHSHSAELIDRFRGGDSQAAAAIYDRYVERLIALVQRRIGDRLAARIDPEDVVQSTYRSFFLKAKDGSFAVRESGELWRLLAGVAKHKLLSQVERHRAAKRSIDREQRTTTGEATGPIDPAPTPEEAASLHEEVQAIMSPLPLPQREALELRLQDHTHAEIAKQLNRSERTIRRWLTQIKETLIAQNFDLPAEG